MKATSGIVIPDSCQQSNKQHFQLRIFSEPLILILGG